MRIKYFSPKINGSFKLCSYKFFILISLSSSYLNILILNCVSFDNRLALTSNSIGEASTTLSSIYKRMCSNFIKPVLFILYWFSITELPFSINILLVSNEKTSLSLSIILGLVLRRESI